MLHPSDSPLRRLVILGAAPGGGRLPRRSPRLTELSGSGSRASRCRARSISPVARITSAASCRCRTDAQIASAELIVTADNLFTLSINGVPAGEGHPSPDLWSRPKRFDVTALVTAGAQRGGGRGDQYGGRPGWAAGETHRRMCGRATRRTGHERRPGCAPTRKPPSGINPASTTGAGVCRRFAAATVRRRGRTGATRRRAKTRADHSTRGAAAVATAI